MKRQKSKNQEPRKIKSEKSEKKKHGMQDTTEANCNKILINLEASEPTLRRKQKQTSNKILIKQEKSTKNKELMNTQNTQNLYYKQRALEVQWGKKISKVSSKKEKFVLLVIDLERKELTPELCRSGSYMWMDHQIDKEVGHD